MVEEIISKSIDDTRKFAKSFAKTLNVGDIVLLKGDLGSGKTVFVKAVAEELSGGRVIAVSPTFLIVNVYETTPPVYHFDLYRINDVSELDAIGAEEYLYSDGISFVEWPERAEDYFYGKTINIEIIKKSDSERLIRIDR